ncbi:MAG: hypothetical protein AAGF11_45655 [Myxococcota bacterium]
MLKHLSVDEMVGLTHPWLDDTQAEALFCSIPEIAPLHSKVKAIHAALLAARPPSKARHPKLRALMAEASSIDIEHDALARAIHAGLLADRAFARAETPPATDRADRADRVLAAMFPRGLSIVNASLLAQSGNTVRVASLLATQRSVADYLDTIPVQNAGTLLTLTQRWIAAGERLAELEHDKAAITAKVRTVPVTRAAMNRLRARWIRLVNQVLTLLDLSDAPLDAIETIRGPVLAASSRAGRRYEQPRAPAPVLTLVTNNTPD